MTAATRMALFSSALNAPYAYMPWLDGRGYKAWGPRGLMATDAILGLAAAGALLLILRLFWRSEPRKAEMDLASEATVAP